MKEKMFILILFTLASIKAFTQTYNDNIQEIVKAAKDGMASYLEKIPPGKEYLYGFKNRDEFKIATLGYPYQITTIPKEYFFHTSMSSTKEYITPIGEYCVPISIKGEYRVILTVAMIHRIWKPVDIGATEYAKKLCEFEKRYPCSGPNRQILRIYQLATDFILMYDERSNGFKAYSFHSSKISSDNMNDEISSFSLNQLLTMAQAKSIQNNSDH